tara:strand:- start:1034 stop:1870 length:837 start_codon:yes stop_codon:yes gene_type:complete
MQHYLNKKKITTQKMKTSLSRLLQVVSDLRDPSKGCPWDLNQTHKSLIPYVLEEAHEVADAIRNENDECLIEELGDLLLQVIMHAQIGKEENRFCLEDIINVITLKMIRRHPHVFTEKKADSIGEVNKIWEDIKETEKSFQKSESPLSDYLKQKIRSQSAVYGSMTISKKVAKEGFVLYQKDELWDRLYVEIESLKNAINHKDQYFAEKELGDLLFTIINIAQSNHINPEESLTLSNKMFLSRFSFVEKTINGSIRNQSINYLKELWEKATKILQKNS